LPVGRDSTDAEFQARHQTYIFYIFCREKEYRLSPPLPSILDRRVRGEGSMQYSTAYVVAVTTLVAGALVLGLGSGASYAAKSKPVVVKVSQAAAPSQPVRLRYYGGPKSPMYP
jgi:hypothetical protein